MLEIQIFYIEMRKQEAPRILCVLRVVEASSTGRCVFAAGPTASHHLDVFLSSLLKSTNPRKP